MGRTRIFIGLVTSAALVVASAGLAHAVNLGAWSPAVSAESISGTSTNLNTTALEGCAFVSQRDDILYFASNRSGRSDLDIWYSQRTPSGGWSSPVNFTEVNSGADDFCPTAHRNGRTFLFVSNRSGGCGGSDVYVARRHASHGWAPPQNLGCTVNSAADEAGPYLLDDELYFSSVRAGGFTSAAPDTDGDIYLSTFDGVSFAAPVLAPGLNTAANDLRPNLRRDGLEIFFDSNRTGGEGGLDLWTSTRTSTSAPWSVPTNLGTNVNSPANDLRASLSWDGATLYFGSVRGGGEGSQDLYVTTRSTSWAKDG